MRMDGLEGLVTQPLARRGFVMTGLITGFTLATERVLSRRFSASTNTSRTSAAG
jgi:carboxymethylenebutenolidase